MSDLGKIQIEDVHEAFDTKPNSGYNEVGSTTPLPISGSNSKSNSVTSSDKNNKETNENTNEDKESDSEVSLGSSNDSSGDENYPKPHKKLSTNLDDALGVNGTNENLTTDNEEENEDDVQLVDTQKQDKEDSEASIANVEGDKPTKYANVDDFQPTKRDGDGEKQSDNDDFDDDEIDVIQSSDNESLNRCCNKKFKRIKHDNNSNLRELWFARFIVNKPWLLCLLIWLVIIGCLYVDSLYFALSDNNNRTWYVETDRFVERLDMLTLAQDEASKKGSDVKLDPQIIEDNWWTWFLMFRDNDYKNDLDDSNSYDTDYWILTPDKIETMLEYENLIYEDEEWQERFCLVYSIPREIYNHYNGNYSSMDIDWIKNYTIHRVRTDSIVETLFNPTFLTTNQTWLYRSYYKAGLPYPTYIRQTPNGTFKNSTFVNEDDNFKKQNSKYHKWGTPIWEDTVVKHNGNLKKNNLQIMTICFAVYEEYWQVVLEEASSFVIFAIVMVLIYMTFHLKSFVMAFTALIQILMCFSIAYFIYRMIFQIKQYDTLSSLIVFVLLGVGADDVFVFTDAWVQSIHYVKDENDMLLRMSFACRRATKAMLVTTSTTFFAFLATATATVMPISAFGIWASLTVASNYLLVITLYPVALFLWEKYVKKYEYGLYSILCCCCKCCPLYKYYKKGKSKTSGVNEDKVTEMVNTGKRPSKVAVKSESVANVVTPYNSNTKFSEGNPEENYRAIEKFLGGKFASFVIKCRYFILIFFLLLFIVGIYGASLIERQNEDEQWFNDNHFMQKSVDWIDQFNSGIEDGLVTVQVYWGLKRVNRKGTDYYNPEDFGKIVYEKTFNEDIANPTSQLYMQKVCEDLRAREIVYEDALDCFTDGFQSFLNEVKNTSFPYYYGNFNDTSDDGYDPDTQVQEFNVVFKEFIDNDDYGSFYSQSGQLYVNSDNEIIYAGFDGYGNIAWDASSEDTIKERNRWDRWRKSEKEECKDDELWENKNICNFWYTSEGFAWIATEDAFILSAVQGIGIAMPLAFLVLIISTSNWVIASFATLDIIGVMLSELAVMASLDWKFGVSESISIVIIIGFSVDYVVHLAHAYLEADSSDRNSRLRYSLKTMGISVISGAVTTLLSGSCLLFPELIFFVKMGTLIMTTISLSIVWALFFFSGLLATKGPENDEGYVPIKEYIKYYCFCNKNVLEDENSNETVEQYIR